MNGEMKQAKEESFCGSCCWFKHEDTDGNGLCAMLQSDYCRKSDDLPWKLCGDECCEHYVSNKQMRHYMAVLLQANRYRRDQHVPAWHKMPHPTDLGKAIDFAVTYMKVFSEY